MLPPTKTSLYPPHMSATSKLFGLSESGSGSQPIGYTVSLGYAVAVAGTAVAAWLHWELGRLLGQDLPPFVTFYPVIILSALFGGTRVGMLATVLAAAVVDFLFLMPPGSLMIEKPADMAGMVIFIVTNLILSVMSGALREVYHRTQLQAHDLTRNVELLDLASVCVCDMDQRITRWNSACQELYGFTREQALGKISHELLHTLFPEPLECITAKVLECGRWVGELKQTDNRWRQHVVATEWLLRQEPAGRPSILIKISADVTETKHAQDLLVLNEARFRTLVEVTNQVIWICSPCGEYAEDSSTWSEFTGRSSDQLTGWSWLESVHPEDRDRVAAAWKNALKHVVPYTDDYRLIHYSGSYRLVHARAVPVRTADGNVREWISTLNDITSTKQAETDRNTLASILTCCNDAIISKTLDGVVTSWNSGAERLFGYTAEQILGTNIQLLTPMDCLAEEAHFCNEVRLGQTVSPYESQRFTREGRLIDVSISASPIYDGMGQLVGLSKIIRDITEQKNNEEALRKTRDDLTQTNFNLEEMVLNRTAELQETVDDLEHFSYTLTHDMRAPLRALCGFAQLLQDESLQSLDETAKGHLDHIKMSASRMDTMITDALQYSWALRGVFPLKPVNVATLLQELLVADPHLQPPHAQIFLDGDFPPVLGNKSGLTQCFASLLDNAVKFVTPGITPRVRVWAETREDFVRIWVEDNGTGIPKEYHERIWVMFQRLGKPHEGTGIGLAIVRKVVQRMGGRVGVESEPDAGSRFWVELKGL